VTAVTTNKRAFFFPVFFFLYFSFIFLPIPSPVLLSSSLLCDVTIHHSPHTSPNPMFSLVPRCTQTLRRYECMTEDNGCANSSALLKFHTSKIR
jgi:hypothetical protein